MIKAKKLKTGGSVLLERHGPEYFSNLRKKGWEKAKKANALFEKQEAKRKA